MASHALAHTGSPDSPKGSKSSALQLRIRSAADFTNEESLRKWEALAEFASEPNPFLEYWSLLPAIAALGKEQSVDLMCLEDHGVLAGVMPIVKRQLYYHYPLPHFANWVHGNCFLGAPLVAKGCEAEFWRALLGWADHSVAASMFFHLTAFPLDGPLFAKLKHVAQEEQRPFAIVQQEERALLQSDLSPEDYWQAALPTKKRKELRRQQRRLEEQGCLSFERETDGDALDLWTSEFLALENAGWKGERGHALVRDGRTAELFRATLKGAATRRRLERLTLRLDGAPIAMLANLIAQPGAFAYKTTYDERFARFSPGVLLQQRNLALLEHHRAQWCDSCASQDHPMIDKLWSERRRIGRINIGIGGPRRQRLYGRLLAYELRGDQ